jgi:hypothetical protein
VVAPILKEKVVAEPTIPDELWMIWVDNEDKPHHSEWLPADDSRGAPGLSVYPSEEAANEAAMELGPTILGHIHFRPVRVK